MKDLLCKVSRLRPLAMVAESWVYLRRMWRLFLLINTLYTYIKNPNHNSKEQMTLGHSSLHTGACEAGWFCEPQHTDQTGHMTCPFRRLSHNDLEASPSLCRAQRL